LYLCSRALNAEKSGNRASSFYDKGKSRMEVVKHISPQAERLLSEYQLGTVKAEYRDDWRKTAKGTTLFLSLGLLFIAIVIAILSSSSPAAGSWSQWSEQLGNMLPLLLFGGFFMLIGLAGLALQLITLWKGPRRVYVGDKGFISARRGIEVATRWEGVREIRRRILFMKGKSNNVMQVSIYSSYYISPIEGKVCSLSNELGAMVEESVTVCLLPHALEKYDAGQWLSFDWLALDQQGIHLTPNTFPKEYTIPSLEKLPGVTRTPKQLQGTAVKSGEQLLAWSKLEMLWIDESCNTLVISQKDGRRHWAILPLSQISNVAICMAVVDHTLHDNTREAA
jgi:hypothetical protein